jgi:hypothetical protein
MPRDKNTEGEGSNAFYGKNFLPFKLMVGSDCRAVLRQHFRPKRDHIGKGKTGIWPAYHGSESEESRHQIGSLPLLFGIHDQSR